MRRPLIVLLVGLPGSGKSTWAGERKDGAVLSSDDIRGWLSDDPTNQTIHRQTFATLRYLLRQRLELRRPVTYVDATNLTRKDRRQYVKLAGLHDCEIDAVFFDVPVDVCLARNHGRTRVVPDAVVRDMAGRLAPPVMDEGFSRITVIRGDLPDPPSHIIA